ncbi:MAG TPA: hypothetical protein VGM88_02960 [Kofleriaceae bacterium]|jgi:hypothetical protein
MPKEATTLVAFRLPNRVLTRVDQHMKRMNKRERGVTYTRTDAVHELLVRGLDATDDEEKKS